MSWAGGSGLTKADRLVGLAFVAVSAASFGTLAIFARFAYRAGAEVPAMLFCRFAIAAVLLGAVMVARRERWPQGRSLAALVGLGGIGYVGQSLSFFTALQYATASLVSLLLYLFPAIVVLLSVAFLGERLTRTKVVALVLAVAGSALTVGSAVSGRPLGVALGVAAALIYSCYIVLGSRVAPGAGAIATSTVIMASAALVYGVVVLVSRPAFPTGATGTAAVVGLAVATVIAVATFFAGMTRLGPADTSTLSTLEPVVTVLLAATILNEQVVALQLVGGALILTAVVLLARTRPLA